MIREIENPNIFEVLGVKLRALPAGNEAVFPWENLEIVGSGKAALSLVLGYLRKRGDFPILY